MPRKPIDRKSPRPEDDLLESFLGAFENFVTQVGSHCIEAAPKGEQRVMVQATADSLVGQTRKVMIFVRQMSGQLSRPQRVELDRFLLVQDGVAIAERGAAVSGEVLRTGIIGKLLHWLAQHFKELKKILSEIIHFILELLHIPYPDWLDKLFQLLDQFLDLLLSLLGEVFGIDFGRTARQLSDQEVNFLREWAAFEAIRVVRASGRSSTPEEA
jgi:hypothetical protein